MTSASWVCCACVLLSHGSFPLRGSPQTFWHGKLLGTSFQKALRAFRDEARKGFGVHQCIYILLNADASASTFDSASAFNTFSRLLHAFGHRDARKVIGVQQYLCSNERLSPCGIRPRRPARHFGSLFLIIYHAKMFAGWS